MPVSGSVLLLYAGAHKISLKYLFPEKMFIEVCCQKCQKCNTICVTTFFYWILRVCKKKKKIKYIHQNLRYYETIEQIHFMVVKK
jgi:epoxyqueuosine reductase QueG